MLIGQDLNDTKIGRISLNIVLMMKPRFSALLSRVWMTMQFKLSWRGPV